MNDVLGEMKRLEEKQKLTNLQIDKRLSLIEEKIDSLNPSNEDNSDLRRNVAETLREIRQERQQIESEINKSFEDLKNDLEGRVEGVMEMGKDVQNIKQEIVNMKLKSSKELEEIAALGKTFDVSSFTNDLDHMRLVVENVRKSVDEKVDHLDALQEQLIGLEGRGKLPQCIAGFETLSDRVNFMIDKIEKLDKKLNKLERGFLESQITNPIVLE